MPTLPFLEYRPDVGDLDAKYTRHLGNVIPRSDGYGPVNATETFTGALAAACRGYFWARNTDGTATLFAGTSERLYKLDNNALTWSDVSRGGAAYATLAIDANWSFAQFNTSVIACQGNDEVQVWTLGSSSAFANLGGSPPRAGWVAVVSRFLVLADLAANPFRVQWSGLNAITTWTSGTNNSDYQDLPDGGRLRVVGEVSGGVALLVQEDAARRMVFAPGSEEVFQVDRLQHVPGILCPYSFAVAPGGAYYLAPKGFVRVDADGGVLPIGEERVDRTVLGEHPTTAPSDITALAYDSNSPELVQAAADPKRSLVLWVYKSTNGSSGLFDKGLVYHTVLQRWAPLEISGECLAAIRRPGLTLEELDALAPGAQTITNCANNGSGLIRVTVGSTSGWSTGDSKTISSVGGTTEANGTWTITVISSTTIDLQGSTFTNAYTSGGVVGGSLDAITYSLDDVTSASLPNVSLFNSAHKLGVLTGDALEATLETAETQIPGWRMNINGLRPLTDASSVYGSVRSRDTLHAAYTAGSESLIDSDGVCPLLDEARFARAKIRIPAATGWSYASGVELDVSKAGRF